MVYKVGVAWDYCGGKYERMLSGRCMESSVWFGVLRDGEL